VRARAIPAGLHVRERAPVAPSPARGLTALAGDEDADLIVIGSSTHGEAGRVRLERTAGRLLEIAPCAVAIAPGGLRDHGAFREIAVAYDDSAEARSALAAAFDIAASCSAAVTLVYALPPSGHKSSTAVEALAAATERAPAGVRPRTMLVHGSPAEVIRHACEGTSDLLVAGSRSNGPMQRALLGSVSEQLAEGASQPVIVVPASEDGGKTRQLPRENTDRNEGLVGHA
jgi:nucleotide-binding universal stress UspA family protein